MEYDARSVITTWGHRSGSNIGGLRDYAALFADDFPQAKPAA